MTRLARGFEQLRGQETVINALQKAIEDGRLGHAILFSGPPGSGKSTLAMLTAQALNCEAEGLSPCEECLSCLKLARGNHPDVVVVEPQERSLKIDQLREVRGSFIYHNYEAESRVCIIEEAHKMTGAAAATLLKIMEEPPPQLVFILTTPYPSWLPATILSRCQHYGLQRLSDKKMESFLQETFPEASPEEIAMAVRLGEGIPGRALDVISQDEWVYRQEMVYGFGKKLISPVLAEHELFKEARNWAEREDLHVLMELLAMFFKDGLMWKLCGDEYSLPDESWEDFWNNCVFDDDLVLQNCLELVNNTRKRLLTNINTTLALENLFLQIRGRIC